MAGTWTTLTNQPTFNTDTMLLLTDGTVMAKELLSSNWHKLTPLNGDYTQGTWSALQPMLNNPSIPTSAGGPTYAPVYFASAVLADGTVFVAGGEDNAVFNDSEVLSCELYDPVSDSWTIIAPPAGWTTIGDAITCVFPDGRMILGKDTYNDSTMAIYDPVTQTWTPVTGKGDASSEETFTLLPDGTILTVQCQNVPFAEKYIISTGQWVPASQTPSALPQACAGDVPEIGPAILLPDGRVFAIGSTGNTALYTAPAIPANPGTWAAGPTMTDAMGNTLYPMDAGAVLLPNGKVLCVGSPAPPCSYPSPTTFFEYDPATNSLTIAPSPTNSGAPCYKGRFLLLPSGQVLFSNWTTTISVYVPDGAPNPSWKPVITIFPPNMFIGNSYTIAGTQINGLSQANSYGDDAQMATNYPIIQMTNTATGNVIFLRTYNHSSMGVATGAVPQSTTISVPVGTPAGSYNMVLIANGIPSASVVVQVGPPPAVYILGGYQSADIILTDLSTNLPVPLGGAPSGPWDTLLQPGTNYGFSAMVHNQSLSDAMGTVVQFWAIPGGVGTNGTLVDTQTVTVPAMSSLQVQSANPFTSAAAGQHLCAVVSIFNAMAGCTVNPMNNALAIPNPYNTGDHGCSAWRNTDSTFAAPGSKFQLILGLGKYDQLPVIGPVRIQVQPFHVPLKWNQNAKVRETENILRSVGVQSRAPLYLLPALRHTLHPIDLHTEITIQKGGKPEPIPFGKEYHLHPEKNQETTFAISGEISRHVTKGDIVLLLVKAHYPKSEKFHARTIEFLEVFHIKDK